MKFDLKKIFAKIYKPKYNQVVEMLGDMNAENHALNAQIIKLKKEIKELKSSVKTNSKSSSILEIIINASQRDEESSKWVIRDDVLMATKNGEHAHELFRHKMLERQVTQGA